MTRIADTNVLYAFFDTEDAHHQTARKALADPEPILIPREILSETLNLLTTRAGRKTAVDALDYLLALPMTSMAEPVPTDGIIETLRRDQGLLSFADAVVVQTCGAHAAPALTIDKRILQRTR